MGHKEYNTLSPLRQMKIINRILKPEDKFSWEGNTQESIILHTTLGSTYKGAEETLIIRELSYHYIIDKDGTIYQLVENTRAAWHAGVKSNPNLRVRSFFEDNPNKQSIGIAFVGTGTETEDNMYVWMTPEQRDSAVWLIKDIGSKNGIRYNANNIFYHREVTDYKPFYVKYIMETVVRSLVGFKNEKDNVKELTILKLRVQLLKLQLKLLLKKFGLSK